MERTKGNMDEWRRQQPITGRQSDAQELKQQSLMQSTKANEAANPRHKAASGSIAAKQLARRGGT